MLDVSHYTINVMTLQAVCYYLSIDDHFQRLYKTVFILDSSKSGLAIYVEENKT